MDSPLGVKKEAHRKRSPSGKKSEHKTTTKAEPKGKAGGGERHGTKKDKEEISDAKPAMTKEKRERENMDSKEAVGDYLLLKMLGKGAFGVVYKAIHRLRGNTVAIKQLNMKKASEEDMRNLKMEINLLQSLNHPNIVQYIDQMVSPKSQQLNIVMEYIENGSLATMVANYGRFPETLCKTYIQHTLRGLAYLHQQGVIHRDIKGGNLLITRDGEVKLADFGVSTKLQAATEGASLSAEDDDETKIPAGTPYYMAPEVIQFLGAKPQSDVWSLGCTIIELLTGEPPYFKLDPFSAMYRMVQDDYPPIPSGISNVLMDFLMLCFNKDHNMRISTQALLQHSWVREVRSSSGEQPRPSRNVDSVKAALEQYKEAFAEVEDQIRKFGTVTEPTNEKMKSNSTFQKMSGYFTAKDTFREGMEKGRLLVEATKAKDTKQAPLQLPKQQQPALKLAIKPASAFVEDDDDDLEMFGDDDFDVAPAPVLKLGVPAQQKPQASPLQLKLQPQLTQNKSGGSVNPNNKRQQADEFEGDGLLRPVVNLSKFKEESDDFDDMDEIGSDSLAPLKLGDVLKKKQEVAWNKWDEDDSFFDVEEQDQKAILQEKVQEALFAEILALFAKLRPDFKDEQAAQSACNNLMEIFTRHPEMLTKLVRKQSLLPLMLTLESASREVVSSVLQLMVQMISNESVLSHLCIMGLIPVIMNWAHHSHPLSVRVQAATLIMRIITSNVQMFIACRGLPILVDLLEPESYEKDAKIVQLSIDCITSIFDHLQQTPIPKNEIDRLFVHSGLLDKLALTLIALIKAGEKNYTLKVCNILINFSLGDSTVKVTMGATNILPHLKKALDIIPESWEATRSFLKVLRNLSVGEKSILTAMEAFIDRLVALALIYVERNEFAKEIYNQILHSVFHICRLNRPRRAGQEKAVKAGIVRFLQYLIKSQFANPLKEFAVPMICDFVQCSHATRKILLKDHCLDTYLYLLSDKAWSSDALGAIATWVESSTEVEAILLKPEPLKQVSLACSNSEEVTLGSLMDSLEKILSVSSKINKALASLPSFIDLVLRPKLSRPPADATARLNLLKVVERMLQLESGFLQRAGLVSLIQGLAQKDPALLVKRLAQFLLGESAPNHSISPSSSSSSLTYISTSSTGSNSSGPSSSVLVSPSSSGPPTIDLSELDSLAV